MVVSDGVGLENVKNITYCPATRVDIFKVSGWSAGSITHIVRPWTRHLSASFAEFDQGRFKTT